MGTVLVTGDVVLNHDLLRESGPSPSPGGSTPLARFETQAGGAWFLADLVGVAFEDLEWRVVGPERQADTGGALHNPEKRFAHAFATWEPFPRNEREERSDKSWRIREIVGRSPAVDPLPPQFREEVAHPDVLVIDDSDLGFRSREDHWPSAIRGGDGPPEIVLRAAERVGEGALWKQLALKHGKALTVVVPIASLRACQAAVSIGLSWDRTLDDLAREFHRGVLSRTFVGVARVVVLFPGVGVVWLSGGDEKRAPSLDRCVFHPSDLDDGWRKGQPGITLGATSMLTAAVARHRAAPSKYPAFVASARALEAMRVCHRHGGGPQNSFQPQVAAALVGEALHPKREARANEKCARCPQPKKGELDPDSSWPSRTAFRSTIPELAPNATGLPATRSSSERHNLLLDVTGPEKGDIDAIAARIVREGASRSLDAAPCARFGKFFTVDRDEIERINEIRSLIGAYHANPEDRKPLALAAFGPPGSGKSFAIKQLAVDLFGQGSEELEFNLSQMDPESGDLAVAFHQVRDATIRGAIPFVFWDEFDSRKLEWLAKFLSPIQDGGFREHGQLHVFGKAVFVFAGGTKDSYQEFLQAYGRRREQKVLDFVSRLRGYMDVKGVNPLSEEDHTWVLRRAVVLRSVIERTRRHLLDPSGLVSIGAGVLHALLHATRYEHGARSLESILAMSTLTGVSHFGSASLPSEQLLRLHVSDDFLSRLTEGEAGQLSPELIEILARGGHAGFRSEKERQGYQLGPVQCDVHLTHPDIRDWQGLSDRSKRDNRDPVPHRWVVLRERGYTIKPSSSASWSTIELPDVAALVEREHQIWLRSKWVHGWTPGDHVSRPLCMHTDMKPYQELPDSQKALNHAIVSGMFAGLANEELVLVKETMASETVTAPSTLPLAQPPRRQPGPEAGPSLSPPARLTE